MSGLEGTGREGDEPIEDETAIEESGVDETTDDVEELSLTEEEEPLPWLESGEYDEEDDGVDSGRIIGFVLLALLGLAALIAAIWYFSNRGSDPELVADGSTIEAPEGAVKEKPENPGGRKFPTTGDVAPAVSEGQTREGRLADNSGGANDDGVAVQVGAYSTKASAETGWKALARQTDAFKGFKYRIVEGQADIGTVFRLQAVASDAAAAKQLCDTLRADGLACQVK